MDRQLDFEVGFKCFFIYSHVMDIYKQIKESYKSGKQLWVCSEEPSRNKKEIADAMRDVSKSVSLYQSPKKGEINKYVFWQILPDYLMIYLTATEREEKKGHSIDFSRVPRGYIENFAVQQHGTLPEIFEGLGKYIEEGKRTIASVHGELLEEAALKEDILHKLPDPEEWAEKTYKLHKTGDRLKYNWFQRGLRKLKGERNAKIFTDTFSELEGDAARFLLEYFGDKKISQNIFLVVSSSVVPEYENRNWGFLPI